MNASTVSDSIHGLKQNYRYQSINGDHLVESASGIAGNNTSLMKTTAEHNNNRTQVTETRM